MFFQEPARIHFAITGTLIPVLFVARKQNTGNDYY